MEDDGGEDIGGGVVFVIDFFFPLHAEALNRVCHF